MLKTEPIIRRVCEYYGVDRSDLFSRERRRAIVLARSMAMYAMYSANYTYSEIGRLFGRDHSTVMYCIRSVIAESQYNNSIRDDMDFIVGPKESDAQAYTTRAILVRAEQQREPFRHGGIEYQAGDYLVMQDNTWAMKKELFEKLFTQDAGLGSGK